MNPRSPESFLAAGGSDLFVSLLTILSSSARLTLIAKKVLELQMIER